MSECAPPMTVETIRRLRRSLLAFFRDRKRELPWRDDSDPYRILVSEVMLQQTRVEAVVPYYRRWIERFPDLNALADADLDEVLGLWAGLGYYARARNLHRTARLVRERHGGVVPAEVESLRELPGIGEYTAGAVASIAFGVRAPAVDGNVRRVMARLHDDPAPSAAGLRRWVSALVDPEDPGSFNQALMELGSTVCLPRRPRCDECPVQGHCLAHRRGTAEDRPAPKRRAPIKEMRVGVAVLVRDGGGGPAQVLLRRRPEEGLLGGTWEFPGMEAVAGEGEAAAAVGAALQEGWAGEEPEERLGVIDHRFSHRAARYHVYRFHVPAGASELGVSDPHGRGETPGSERRIWLRFGALSELPLTAAQARIRELLLG